MAAGYQRPTPAQTVGPFFNIGMPGDSPKLVAAGSPGAIALGGVVRDGEGVPVPDALIELWQADPAGRYDHPEDRRDDPPMQDGFRGFGRSETDAEGAFEFVTVKPGPVPGPDGVAQAPHISVSVFARGLLKHLTTRIYFADEADANAEDRVLASIESADRRSTLLAVPGGNGGYRFDIHLQGESETVFFDV